MFVLSQSTIGRLLNLFFGNWELILRAAKDEIVKKNAGSVFGSWWLVLSPVIFLSIYSLIYLVIFKFKPLEMDQNTYVLHIFCGILPFIFHAEAVVIGSQSLNSNKSVLKSNIFPIEIIVVKTILACLPTFVIGMAIVCGASLWLGIFSPYLLLLPLFVFLQVLFLIGLSWILSLVSIVVKDVNNLLVYLNMLLMVLSPIAYTIDMVPKNLQFILWTNPLAYFVLTYQALLHQTLPAPFIYLTLIGMSLFTFFIGFVFFKNTKMSVVRYV